MLAMPQLSLPEDARALAGLHLLEMALTPGPHQPAVRAARPAREGRCRGWRLTTALRPTVRNRQQAQQALYTLESTAGGASTADADGKLAPQYRNAKLTLEGASTYIANDAIKTKYGAAPR